VVKHFPLPSHVSWRYALLLLYKVLSREKITGKPRLSTSWSVETEYCHGFPKALSACKAVNINSNSSKLRRWPYLCRAVCLKDLHEDSKSKFFSLVARNPSSIVVEGKHEQPMTLTSLFTFGVALTKIESDEKCYTL